jgi:alpha-glucosidase
MLSRYRDLIALRHRHEALRRGGLRWLHAAGDVLVYLRESAAERLLIQARRAPGQPVAEVAALLTGAELVYGGPDAEDGPSLTVWRLSNEDSHLQ